MAIRLLIDRRSEAGASSSPDHLVVVSSRTADDDTPRRSTIVIAQGLRYWLLGAWALLLAACSGPIVAGAWFVGCAVLGLVRGRVERMLGARAGVSVGAELTAIATLTSGAWALAPLLAWRAQHGCSPLATISFLFAGVLLVATQFRHLPRRALIVASPYLMVAVYVLVTAPEDQEFWAMLAAVGVAGSAILTKAFFGRVHKAQIDAFQAEQARLISELETARDAATAASDAKSAFLAVISHELRTPMNGVLGATQLLARDRREGEAAELVAVIDEQGRVLASLLDDVLDFARIEAGRLEVEPEPTAIEDLIRRTVALWRPRAQEKGLFLQLELTPELPDRLLTDPVRLAQMLHNLLSNAVKFTETGGVTVRVSTQASPDGDRLAIAVADTGPGVSPADQGRLFQAFSQIDGTSTRRHGGAGLGLVISRRIAGLLGGDLRLEAASPGARFVIDLPLVAVETTMASATPAAPELRPGRRVLVVEDHAVNRRILSAWLEAAGHVCVLAENGAEGLAALRREAFDLVLMDVNMPVMDGLEAVRTLRREGGRTPVVMLSASTTKPDQAAGLDAGADAYMAKPVEFAALSALMARLCGESAQNWRLGRVAV